MYRFRDRQAKGEGGRWIGELRFDAGGRGEVKERGEMMEVESGIFFRGECGSIWNYRSVLPQDLDI